jgi:hypothetical protein
MVAGLSQAAIRINRAVINPTSIAIVDTYSTRATADW